MKIGNITALLALRDESYTVLMRKSTDRADKTARQDYFDFIKDQADLLLDHITNAYNQAYLVDAAKFGFITLLRDYGGLSVKETGKRYGSHIVKRMRQMGQFENDIKLGHSGKDVRPFLPGVQEALACEMIVAAQRYEAEEQKTDPDIFRHYIAAMITGVRELNDDHLLLSLRPLLEEAENRLRKLAGGHNAPAFIEGATLSGRGEVRKPSKVAPANKP